MCGSGMSEKENEKILNFQHKDLSKNCTFASKEAFFLHSSAGQVA
jgi:hypothetical protein